MGKIIELSQHVANQIAAGEVVERPSSVVKELLENSLDAGASEIEIRIKDGGFLHIVVQDDGIGMDEADVTLAVKRYATSKLRAASDLETIQTFGFRGEALPSIASISKMTLISRPEGQAYGIKASIEAGVMTDIGKASAPRGTRVLVQDLFFNVPARLKFAKSKRAEAADIDRLLRAYAFMNPSVSFKYFVDDRLIFAIQKTSNDHDLYSASALLGKDTEGYLYEINTESELIKISGAIAAPMVVRRDGRDIVLFINNRLISDKKLVMAVKTAFKTLLEVGRSPACALKIEIASDEVDVNVHPRKAEVRFRNERRVLSHVISLLNNFLSETPWLSRSSSLTRNETEGYNEYQKSELEFLPRAELNKNEIENFRFVLTAKALSTPQKNLLLAKKFSDLRIIGQVRNTYLLTESDDGFVVIDQHAAHERVMFEKIRKQKGQKIVQTPLLIPISLDLGFREMALFLDHVDDLASIGIDGEAFGEHSVVVRALPNFVQKTDVSSFVKDILSDLSQHGRADSAKELFEHVCATLACHGSIRAGQKMNREEIEALLIELDITDFGAHCPHGRPIVKSFSDLELKKWFDRT